RSAGRQANHCAGDDHDFLNRGSVAVLIVGQPLRLPNLILVSCLPYCGILPARWQMIAGESLAVRWRKVRTPYGSMPRKIRGRRSRKRTLTESVTEKTPPVL